MNMTLIRSFGPFILCAVLTAMNYALNWGTGKISPLDGFNIIVVYILCANIHELKLLVYKGKDS